MILDLNLRIGTRSQVPSTDQGRAARSRLIDRLCALFARSPRWWTLNDRRLRDIGMSRADAEHQRLLHALGRHDWL